MNYNLANIKKQHHTLDLSPGNAVDIMPGIGFNMDDALFPRRAIKPPFLQKLTSKQIDQPGDNDLVNFTGLYIRSDTVEKEAKKLAFSFSAKYSIASARASYSRAREEIKNKTIVYLVFESVGTGKVIDAKYVDWKAKPEAENIRNVEQRMRQFLADHGSHYVSEVTFGQRLIIRATCNSKTTSDLTQFDAALKASATLFKGSANLSTTHYRFLSSSKCEVDTAIVGGSIQPTGAAYVTSISDTMDLLRNIKKGSVVIKSGPVQCRLQSYWHTLRKYRRCQSLFGPYEEPDPVLAPYGVPARAIVAWFPTEESLHRDAETSEIIKIIPPEGWAICDGQNGTPNLTEKFIMGNIDAKTIGDYGGVPVHRHRTKGSTGLQNWGKYQSQPEGADNNTGGNWVHTHSLDLESEEETNIPPNVQLVYIMKL